MRHSCPENALAGFFARALEQQADGRGFEGLSDLAPFLPRHVLESALELHPPASLEALNELALIFDRGSFSRIARHILEVSPSRG